MYMLLLIFIHINRKYLASNIIDYIRGRLIRCDVTLYCNITLMQFQYKNTTLHCLGM